jgi:hypothetical protein
MKKVVFAGLLVAMFGATAQAGSSSDSSSETKAQAHSSAASVLDFRTGRFFAANSSTTAGTYPDCRTMDGAYCSTPGATARCYWYAYSEPGFAVCQSDNTWQIY